MVECNSDYEQSGETIHWMQWMDRDSYSFILCEYTKSIISGPHNADDFFIKPVDPILLLKYEALYQSCAEGLSNE